MRQGGELLQDQVLLGVLPLRRTTLCEWPTDFIGTNKRIIPKPVSYRFYTELVCGFYEDFQQRGGFQPRSRVNALPFEAG